MRLEIIWIFQPALCRSLQVGISKRHAYSVLLHADPFPFANAVDAGIIDELVDESDFEARVMEKAADLATLGHPHYEKTKNAYIADDVKIIKPLIVK
jgi:enoyl-CoA hydratase/carnithine racemase